MPLHEWTDRQGWDGVHQLWIVELLYWIKPRLPAGYRAYIRSAPTLEIGDAPGIPDVSVREWPTEPIPPATDAAPLSLAPEPDETLLLKSIEPSHAVYVERQGCLTAAVELVSPRNKDRPDSRAFYLGRYLGYLLEGAHLLLVDVHRRPLGFSFADRIAQDLEIVRSPLPTPMAVSYRVGDPFAPGDRLLAVWRRPLTVGAPLPVLALPLTEEAAVPVDLEQTYSRAAADAYL